MMTFNNLEIFIQRDYSSDSLEVWLREKRYDETLYISYEDNGLKVRAIKSGEIPPNDLKPFMKLPSHFAEILFKSISDYTSKEGIKTDNENLLKGKLVATEEHLKDMREFSRKLLDASIK